MVDFARSEKHPSYTSGMSLQLYLSEDDYPVASYEDKKTDCISSALVDVMTPRRKRMLITSDDETSMPTPNSTNSKLEKLFSLIDLILDFFLVVEMACSLMVFEACRFLWRVVVSKIQNLRRVHS